MRRHFNSLALDVVDAVDKCRLYCCVPGALQSVQRTEIQGMILVLQAATAVHVGILCLNEVRHDDRVIQGVARCKLFLSF